FGEAKAAAGIALAHLRNRRHRVGDKINMPAQPRCVLIHPFQDKRVNDQRSAPWSVAHGELIHFVLQAIPWVQSLPGVTVVEQAGGVHMCGERSLSQAFSDRERKGFRIARSRYEDVRRIAGYGVKYMASNAKSLGERQSRVGVWNRSIEAD